MNARHHRAERLPCERCNRIVATFIPSGGDGSALRVRRHNTPSGEPCDGFWAKLNNSRSHGDAPDELELPRLLLGRGG